MSIFTTDLTDYAYPMAVLDQEAMEANIAAMSAAAAGTPIRVASKSIRVRGLIENLLQRPEFAGVMCYSAAEALWLHECGLRDLLVAYPSVDCPAITKIAADSLARAQVTFMVDLPEHIELLAQVAQTVETELGEAVTLRACLDVDASLRLGGIAVGAHRSSVHTPAEAEKIAALIADTPGVELVAAMFYEAQVAGVPDATPVHKWLKRRSLADLAQRRGECVAAISKHAHLEFVNGGGTGSLLETRKDATITELAAGSGLYTPHSFDNFAISLRPAAYMVTRVTRKPLPETVVAAQCGYVASGQAEKSRWPRPVWPEGLTFYSQEGAGEVQTPLHGQAAARMQVGDAVWFRHTKAGEMLERFSSVLIARRGRVVQEMATYRGEGKNFG